MVHYFVYLQYVQLCGTRLQSLLDNIKRIGTVDEYAIVKRDRSYYVYALYSFIKEDYVADVINTTTTGPKRRCNVFDLKDGHKLYAPIVYINWYKTDDTLHDTNNITHETSQLNARRAKVLYHMFESIDLPPIDDYTTDTEYKLTHIQHIKDTHISFSHLIEEVRIIDRRIGALIDRIDILENSIMEWRTRIEHRIDAIENENK